MIRKRSLLTAFLALSLLLTACASPFSRDGTEEPEETEPVPTVDFDGLWMQVNRHNDDNYQIARISDEYIEIYWILEESYGASLWWAGDFVVSEDVYPDSELEIRSNADTSRTTLSLLTAKDNYINIKYDNGRLVYDVPYDTGSDEIIKMNVKCEKQDLPPESSGIPDLAVRGTVDMFDIVNSLYQDYVGFSPYAEYHIGDTWTVDGNWELTVTGVQQTNNRNPYVSTEFAAVYQIDYTYTNTGWTNIYDLGLQFTIDDYIKDSIGVLGYRYPLSSQSSPRQIHVGETCEAQSFVSLVNDGTFKFTITEYDTDGQLQGATFVIDVPSP